MHACWKNIYLYKKNACKNITGPKLLKRVRDELFTKWREVVFWKIWLICTTLTICQNPKNKLKYFLFVSGCHKLARNGNDCTMLSQLKSDSAYLVAQFQLRSVAAWLPLRCPTFGCSVASCTQYINFSAYLRGNGELPSASDDSVALTWC